MGIFDSWVVKHIEGGEWHHRKTRENTQSDQNSTFIFGFPRVMRWQGEDQTNLKDRLEQQSLDFCLCTHTNVIRGNTVDLMGNLLRKYSQRTTFAPDVTYLQQTSAKQKILCEQDPEGKPTAGPLAYYSAGGCTNLQLTSDFSGSQCNISTVVKVLLKLSTSFCVSMRHANCTSTLFYKISYVLLFSNMNFRQCGKLDIFHAKKWPVI